MAPSRQPLPRHQLGVTSVGAFVTGNTSITESIFSGSTLLGSVSTGGANFVGADTGVPTNIFLSISGLGITRAVFTNNLGMGNTFTLDNFTFARSNPSPVSGPTAGDPSPVAVPGSIAGAGLPGLVRCFSRLGATPSSARRLRLPLTTRLQACWPSAVSTLLL